MEGSVGVAGGGGGGISVWRVRVILIRDGKVIAVMIHDDEVVSVPRVTFVREYNFSTQIRVESR